VGRVARGLPNAALLAAIVLGTTLLAAAAVLLVGTPGQAPGQRGTPPLTNELQVNLPPAAWGILFLSPLIVGFVFLVYRRLTTSGAGGFGVIVIALLLGLVFYVLLMHGSGGPGFVSIGPAPPPPGNNSSGGGNSSNGSGGGGGSGTSAFHLTIPPYALWIVALVLCAVVLGLTVPGVVSRLVDRRARGVTGGPGRPEREAVADALAEAATSLERGADPRETIVRLYLALLRQVAPMAGELSAATPEEIRRQYLVALGVPGDAATTLTRLFEEARYSTHPIDAPMLGRSRDALRAAEVALRRGAPAA
jgi:hypothetical protein